MLNHPDLHSMPIGMPTLSPDRFSTDNRKKLSGPGMRTFANIADLWQLTTDERLMVLGSPSRSTYFSWLNKARSREDIVLPVDTLLRMSAVLGIHKALRILFNSDEKERAWLKGPHKAPTFGGQPPMALVTNGTQEGLLIVRWYLDAFRGGLFSEPNEADQLPPMTEEDIVIV